MIPSLLFYILYDKNDFHILTERESMLEQV